MSDQERIAELVQRQGIDGLVLGLADYTEAQAENHEDTPTGAMYDAVAHQLRLTAARVRQLLAARKTSAL